MRQILKVAIGIITMISVALTSTAYVQAKQYSENNVHASGNSYWLTGYYEYSKLVYNGTTLKVQKKWRKSSLKDGPSYDGNLVNFNKKIKLSPKELLINNLCK